MAQFARPDGDVTNTGFAGGFADIDEATLSDTDYWSGDNNQADTLEVSLSNVTDPGVNTGHVFRYRAARGDTDGSNPDGQGNSVDVTGSLWQGGTQIATDIARAVAGLFVTYTVTLTETEAGNITDYTDLRLRFVTTSSGGSPANRRCGLVSWAELEVPDSAAPTGSGAISVPSATVTGTGEEVFTATGSITSSPASVAGVGEESFTATGAVTIQAATVAGVGEEVLTATGAITVPTATVAGTGDHTGGGPEPITGTGAFSVPSAAVAGAGEEGFTATGSIVMPAATVAGSGALLITGTGAIVISAATVAALGSEVFTGTSAISVPLPAIAGDGLVAVAATGTGTIIVPVAQISGDGYALGGVSSGGGARSLMGRARRSGVVQPPEDDEEWLVLE